MHVAFDIPEWGAYAIAAALAFYAGLGVVRPSLELKLERLKQDLEKALTAIRARG